MGFGYDTCYPLTSPCYHRVLLALDRACYPLLAFVMISTSFSRLVSVDISSSPCAFPIFSKLSTMCCSPYFLSSYTLPNRLHPFCEHFSLFGIVLTIVFKKVKLSWWQFLLVTSRIYHIPSIFLRRINPFETPKKKVTSIVYQRWIPWKSSISNQFFYEFIDRNVHPLWWILVYEKNLAIKSKLFCSVDCTGKDVENSLGNKWWDLLADKGVERMWNYFQDCECKIFGLFIQYS